LKTFESKLHIVCHDIQLSLLTFIGNISECLVLMFNVCGFAEVFSWCTIPWVLSIHVIYHE